MTRKEASPAKPDPITLKLYRLLVVSCLLLATCSVLSIAFVYETQTLWYRLGIDKTMLRTGQMAGLLAVVLLFVQILLATRGAFLKKLFGIAVLMRWHRVNGIFICLLAISHVLLILVPEGMTNLPIGKRYWSEMLGVLVFFIILAMTISAQFREKFGFNYQRWKVIHKLLGYFVLLTISVHVLFVSESFDYAVPRVALAAGLVGLIVSVIISKKTT